jgi:PAS domain S-box-containing protein
VDSLVLNEPARFYQIDKRYIWTATAGVAVLLAALAMLMSSIRRRQEAQEVLRRHKEQLEEAVRARTEHLRTANDDLEREVNERIRVEGDLRKARASLEIEVDRRTSDLIFEVEQRRQAEAHIRDREAKARALINAPTETLLLMDQAGIILDINDTGASRLGTIRESLIGQSLFDLLPEDRSARLRQAVDGIYASGEAADITEYGQDMALDLHFYPVFDDSGRVTRVAVFMADVTASRRMARQIMLLDKINSLGRMAAGIAHEIRNPLTGIHGYLYAMDEICSEMSDSESAGVLRATIEKIRKAAGKMESVIRRVLDFSKPGTPHLELLDLSGPVQEALSLLGPTLRKAGVDVSASLAPVPPIHGDRMQLEQAVVNIVDNAARALRSRDGGKRVAVSLDSSEGRVRLTIADNGPGIPQADQERIFDPFYTTASDGTGIGLSIVQRIVADHDGSIRVSQSPLGGAEFSVEFPVPAAENP